jgi:hypothetical protein
VAIRQTRRKIGRVVDRPDVRVLVLGDLRAVLLTGAELAREPAAPHLYARHLLGCLDEDARANLWRLAGMALRRGGSLFLELTVATETEPWADPDALGTPPLRRLDLDRLREEIEAAGGRVVHDEVAPGHDFLDRPDPAVARLEVRWDHRPTPTPGGATMTKVADTRRDVVRRAAKLPELVRDLRASVQENRRLNRRVAELTDLVAELLVPLADRDEERARELLARYRETTLAP